MPITNEIQPFMSAGVTYVYYPAQRSNGVCPVNNIASHGCVLHNTAGDHDDIFGGIGELLDDKVDHLAQGGIFVLKQLRNAKEERGGFICREPLAGEEEEGDFGQEDTAFARGDGRGIEHSGYTMIVSMCVWYALYALHAQ